MKKTTVFITLILIYLVSSVHSASSPTWVVIDGFDNDANQADETDVPDAAWWTADSDVYSYPVISTMSFNGSSSLEVSYDKSAGGGKPLAVLNAGDLDNGSNNVSDFSVSASSSISLQVYPVSKDIDILMRLRDISANESNDLQTLNAGTTNQWQRLTWNWDAASLGACDVTRIKEVELLFAPGDSSETGKVYIDDLKLESVGSDVRNFLAVSSTSTLAVSLYWPAAGDVDGDLKEYDVYRATYNFSTTGDANVSLIESTTSLKYSDTGLQGDTSYFYSIIARDDLGNISIKTLNVSTKTATGEITITVNKSTSTVSAKPGEEVTYTITYENTGTGTATNFYITEVVPFNTYISEAALSGTADSVEYYVGSSWQGGYVITATKIRWKDNSISGSSGELSVSYKIIIK